MEVLTVLYYYGVLKYDPSNPDWEERDPFIMSKGHGSTALYPVLADVGFFPKEELNHCLQKEGILGICLNGKVPGVEISTGSLAIGFGTAAGMAKAAKLNRTGETVFVMLGDAECYEGAIWEAALFAAHNQLNNLVAIVDRNFMACTDFTENMLRLEPFSTKWEAFGWDVKVIDGHNVDEIISSLEDVKGCRRSKPLVIIAETVKGKGVDFIENVPLMHGNSLHGQKAEDAIKQIEEV
jgi:transketolase